MITVLRLISQICQCIEDPSKNQTDDQKSSIPLYLRRGEMTDIEQDEFIKTLESISSKRSSRTYKPLIDSKRSIQGENPTIYEFPPSLDSPTNKEIPKAGTPDTEGEGSDKLNPTPASFEEPVTLSMIKSTQKGKAGSDALMIINDRKSEQDKIQAIDEERQAEENEQTQIKQEKDHQPQPQEQQLKIIKVDIPQIEDNQLYDGEPQHRQGSKDIHEEREDFFLFNFKPPEHRVKLKQIDLQTRVKNKRSKRRKKMEEEIDNGKSPYRVNFPKELTTMALHIKEKDNHHQ